MNLIEIVFLSIAMGIDCLVVSFSQGLIINTNRVKNSCLLALTMGLFQGIMPCIGFVGANSVKSYVSAFGHLLTASIFLILGLKFIFEAFVNKETPEKETCCIGFHCLMALGVATSVDAFVAGGSLVFLDVNLLLPAVMIGVVSFLMSLIGFWSGNFLKYLSMSYLEGLGGLILIVLAVKSIM